MKSKTKKILTTICAMILSVFMFAGCNLIELNKNKYYTEKVVVIGLKDGYGDEYKSYEKTYTKKDLLTAYYNYSYNQVSQGASVEDGIENAINQMVNSDLLYNYIKLNFYDNPKYDLDFTTKDTNDVKLQAFDNIQESIFEIENEIFEEWDIQFTGADDLTDEEVKSLRVSYTDYTPSVMVTEVNGKETIILNDSELEVHDTRTAPEHFVQEIRNKEVSREAYTRYIKQLQDAAKAEGLDTNETTVLHNEEKRLIDAYTKSRYMEKFQNWYNKYYNFTYDAVNKVYVLNEDVQNKIVDKYKEEFIEQRDIYSQNESKYHEAMAGNDISKVYYHENSGNEYVYVSHILLKFSDEQVKEIEELDKKLENKLISQERHDELVQDIANRTKVTYEVDNTTHTATASEVYNRISSYVNKGDAILSNPDADAEEKHNALVEKAKRFNDMLYIYNDDEGIMNADYAYVVNLDTEIQDKMVKPFADKAREMHNEGNVGDVSEMVITEYGVHILFYAGEVKNVVEDINKLTAIDLIKHNTQLSSNKTLFSLRYDELSSDMYSTSATNYITNCYEFITITKFEDNFKDLYK